MSKLNDSTLKIFKKYRLDTDMSVFGNENNLYDVVKVMDDMVGGQVGNKIGSISYLSSTESRNVTFMSANAGVSVDVQRNNFIATERYPSDVLNFNPFTMKYLGLTPANSTLVPIAIIIDENFNELCYVGIDLTTGTASTYSDILCSNKIEFVFNTQKYAFLTLLQFTNSSVTFYSSTGIQLYSMMSNGGTVTNVPNKPKLVSGAIILPKEIDMLDLSKPIYVSSGTILTEFSLNVLNFAPIYLLEV